MGKWKKLISARGNGGCREKLSSTMLMGINGMGIDGSEVVFGEARNKVLELILS